MKFKFYKSPKPKKIIFLKSEDLEIPQSVITQSNSLLKTLKSFENLKIKTFRNHERNKSQDLKSLTLKDDEFISSRYITDNQYNIKEINLKYSLNNNLNEFQKSSIQNFIKHKKNNSVITVKKELYSNPYNSQNILNFNNQIYNVLNNIRMETQYNLYSKKINDIHNKEKLIKLMPKILISKIKVNNKKESKIQRIIKLNSSNTLPLLNSTKIISREELFSSIQIKKK